MVPNGWKLGVISDLADTVMGYAFKSADFTKAGIPLLRMGNLYQNTLSFDRNPIYLPKSFKKNYERFLVKPNDLVMSMTGTMGKRDYGFTVKIPTDAPYSLLNQRVIKFVPKHESSSGFLLNLLRSEIILSRLYAIPGGTKQANLSAKQIQELPAPIPPLPEQRKIAKILSTWDNAISTTERLIDNSKQQKKALMQQLLTGKKRLLDDSGKPFEGEWEEVKLNSVAEIKRGAGSQYITYVEKADEGIRLIRISDFLGDSLKYIKHTEDINRFILQKDDLLIAGTGATAGIVFEVPDKLSGLAFSYNAPRIRVHKTTNKKFIYYYLKSEIILNQQLSLFTGNAQPFLDTKAIGGFRIKLPDLKEQQKIASVLTITDKEIELLEQQLADLKQEKKALMQQLLTGKHRVKI